MQAHIASGAVVVGVTDLGRGLFAFLDADHDGAISLRELQTAAARAKAVKAVRDGTLDLALLPRQSIVTVARGPVQPELIPPTRRGPVWFTAMDTNRDGDVSRAEFVGPARAFDRIDSDGDGLINAEEASLVDG